MKTHPVTRTFLKKLGNEHGESLFDHLPDVQFFIKDRQGRYIMVNRCLLLNYGMKDESEILGKTDYDYLPRYIADNYVRDDQLVLQGKRIINRIELMSHFTRTDDWYITNKIPLASADGEVIGVAGITREYGMWKETGGPMGELGNVLDYIKEHYAKNIELSKLAEIACLSESAFGRMFKRLFNMSPMQYIRAVRVNIACGLLIHTREPISEIAVKTGFADHSHFTREFAKVMGRPPKEYRDEYLKTAQI
jgi:AraC-like DNA-binding protein